MSSLQINQELRNSYRSILELGVRDHLLEIYDKKILNICKD